MGEEDEMDCDPREDFNGAMGWLSKQKKRMNRLCTQANHGHRPKSQISKWQRLSKFYAAEIRRIDDEKKNGVSKPGVSHSEGEGGFALSVVFY